MSLLNVLNFRLHIIVVQEILSSIIENKKTLILLGVHPLMKVDLL